MLSVDFGTMDGEGSSVNLPGSSRVHVQMARELGMNPKRLGELDNHEPEPWKLPLPAFIEHL